VGDDNLVGGNDVDDDDDDDAWTDDATSDYGGPEPPTFQKCYAISEKISKGSYGVVYRARHRTTKLLEGDTMVEREIGLLRACREHIENVVKIIENIFA
jgi:serine/threonine protein kinase